MKLFTVTQTNHVDGRIDDVLPFRFAYRSLEQAQTGVREAANEEHLALYEGEEEVPEMEGPFFSETGLEASDIDRFHGDFASDWTDWEITEVDLED